MDEKRLAAWQAAIAKRRQGEEVPLEEHYALLREGMFKGEPTPDVMEEADYFLRYWCGGLNRDSIRWLGPVLADCWFGLRDWDREWDSKIPGRTANRAQEALRKYIESNDYDHWVALNAIAARLHRERERFPDILADWAAECHEGRSKQPAKERGNKGEPPYAQEDRNRVFAMADDWLEHFGMAHVQDRRAAIAGFANRDDVDEEVVRKGLKRWRDTQWRRAPWPH